MRSDILFGLLAVGLAVVAPAAGGGSGGAAGLAGTWTMVVGEKAGQRAPEKDVTAMTVVIAANSLTFTRGDRGETFKISVDATVTPNQINLIGDDGASRPGIYELSGDSLKLCLSGTDQRPADFSSTQSSRNALMVLRRKSK